MPRLPSILLVDDDATANFLNRMLVQQASVAERVLVAENGRIALDMLHEACASPASGCPALLLLDLNMPVMNGLEFLAAYQQLPLEQRQSTTIVMLTTAALPCDLEKLRHLPVAGVLDKPLTREKLLGLLDQHFPA